MHRPAACTYLEVLLALDYMYVLRVFVRSNQPLIRVFVRNGIRVFVRGKLHEFKDFVEN